MKMIHLRRNEIVFGLVWIGAVAGMALLAACSQKTAQSQVRSAGPYGVPVAVATVTQKTVPVQVQAIGNGEAYSTVSIRSQVEGRVERVYFKEGDDVKAGDVLFTIDPRPFEARLKQAQANLARDTAQAKNAQAQAQRYTKLYESGIVSKDQYDQFQTSAEALDAAVRADKAAIEDAQVQLSYCTIRSPLDGRTGNLMVHPGNVVKADDISLVVIKQIQPIYVDFSVPEEYLTEIKKYLARSKLRVEATIPQDTGHPQSGVLTFINNTVEATTGTILLKALFPNPEKRLWPGQFVNVDLKLSEQPNALVVPSQAVQTGQSGQYVFVIKSDLTADMRPVKTGATLAGETVIENGLRVGETVVTDGQLRLAPGAKVEIKTQPETPVQGSSGGAQ